MKRICKQCGSEFELSESEVNFYRKRNLMLPKRCARCRALNRAEKSKAAVENLYEVPVTDKQIVVQAEPVKKKPIALWIVAALIVAAVAIGGFMVQYLNGDDSELLTIAVTTTKAEMISTAEKTTEAKVEPEETQPQSDAEPENTFFDANSDYSLSEPVVYTFRSDQLLEQHYQKHGIAMGFGSAEEYEEAASSVASNPDALHKIEAEDGDDVYYLMDTNEFVIVSTDGYLRTYFYPDDGIDYYNRQ